MGNDAYRILVINPGSTSTKIAVFDGDENLFVDTIRHDKETLDACGSIPEQKEFRLKEVMNALAKRDVAVESLSAVACRGGLLRPLKSGVYHVNDNMLEDLKLPFAAGHASSLAAIIGKSIADQVGIKAYIADPVVVDELEDAARLTGTPLIERRCTWHALNQKEIARRYAAEQGKKYNELRLIVCHMGGGVTVGAHKYGEVVDVNDGLNGEGPFSPERTGGVVAVPLIRLCYSGKYTEQEMVNLITRQGGVQSYIGTNDMRDAEKMVADGNEEAKLVIEAMAFQIAKQIGSMAAVLSGEVDAILLTGGIAYSDLVTGLITERVKNFAPVFRYPGEDEMAALKNGVTRVLDGEEEAFEY